MFEAKEVAVPEARADTAAAASLLDTLDRTTPSRMPTGVAVAKKPITVQNFCMLACTGEKPLRTVLTDTSPVRLSAYISLSILCFAHLVIR